MILRCSIKAILKALSSIWALVQQFIIKWYNFCLPPGLERGFYIVMGGYEIYRPGMEFPQEKVTKGSVNIHRINLLLSASGDKLAVCYGQPWTLTPRGAIGLARLGLLPKMRPEEIRDKSKADSLAKTLVCLQASWMILQCIERKAQGLPVTLLEVNTLVHVVCALLMYLFWLYKPQGVTEPTQVPPGPRLKVLQSLAMESYSLSLDYSGRELMGGVEWNAGGFVNPDEVPAYLATRGNHPIVINIERQFRLMIKRQWGSLFPLKVPSKEDISSFCTMVMERRTVCGKHHIFTSGDALVKSASNYPGSNEGHFTDKLEIEKGAGLLLATVVTAIYGGVHLIPWYSHFATHLERYLWRASGLLIASGGPIWYIVLKLGFMGGMLRFDYQKAFLNNASSVTRLSDIPKLFISLLLAIVTFPLPLLCWTIIGIMCLSMALYFLARVYMVVEAFASLRSLPVGAYQTVTWVDIIPHF